MTTDRLKEYNRKRDFGDTPEPQGSKRSGSSKQLRFVIQKHRATRLHYDFRLEAGGVLASWAVPKGPSLDPKERRLAMHVEDHPLDYRDFEGIIPQGNYGAGEVIVWDRGTYKLAEGTDPVREIANGKIKFILSGKKLHGEFTLVHIRGRGGEENAWLLIKDHDKYVDPSWSVDDHPESAKSGKTIEDLKKTRNPKVWQSNRAAAPAKKTTRTTAKRSDPIPAITTPELATPVDGPFDDPAWLFEIKWDGYRAIARIDTDATVTLTSRKGNDLLAQFPELEEMAQAFRSLPILVDGEIVSLDENGVSSFQNLQEGNDPTFVAFDLLYADGRDLRELPLEERKRHLEELVVPNHRVLYSKHVLGDGTAFFELAERRGLEGIMAKRRDSEYRSRRTRDWLKIKAAKRQEFVIGGWTEPRGSRKDFGSLLVGYYDGDEFRYAGHVGSGFDAKKLAAIKRDLAKLEIDRSPFTVRPKTNTKAHFAKPKLVAEVKFTEWTRDDLLRQPVFLGLRSDKDPKDVVRERELHATEHG